MPRRKQQSDDASAEPLVNLNARVPKPVWYRVRLHCMREGLLLRVFVTEALREQLGLTKKRSRR